MANGGGKSMADGAGIPSRATQAVHRGHVEDPHHYWPRNRGEADGGSEEVAGHLDLADQSL